MSSGPRATSPTSICWRRAGEPAPSRAGVSDPLPMYAVHAAEVTTGIPPQSWGRFRLDREGRRRRFGSVDRAWDPDLQREIAMKILHSRFADPD